MIVGGEEEEDMPAALVRMRAQRHCHWRGLGGGRGSGIGEEEGTEAGTRRMAWR